MPRTLNHSRQRSRFREREIAEFFSIEDSCRFLDSPNRYCAALAQVDLITVQRKDIVLREPALECEGQHRFRILSLKCLFRREVSVLDELLSDRRVALTQSFIARISYQCACYTAEVHARVLEETPILNRE